MNIIKISFISFVVLLAACEDDTAPELDLTGHWIITHDFYEEQCQLGVTFREESLALTFFDLSEQRDACKRRLFGLNGYSLQINIDEKKNYFSEQGALAMDLILSIPDRGVTGNLTLIETAEGLSAVITEMNDPEESLGPLTQRILQRTFHLNRDKQDWLPSVMGKWGAVCGRLYPQGNVDEVCEYIDLTGASEGRAKVVTLLPTVTIPDQSVDSQSKWQTLTFAPLEFKQTNDQDYVFHYLLILDGASNLSILFELTRTDGRLSLRYAIPGTADGGPKLELLPIED